MVAAITLEAMAALLSGRWNRSRKDWLVIRSDMTHFSAQCTQVLRCLLTQSCRRSFNRKASNLSDCIVHEYIDNSFMNDYYYQS